MIYKKICLSKVSANRCNCLLFILFYSFLFAGFNFRAYSQSSRTISGRVSDASNVPLAGVAIKAKAFNVSTMTNDKGLYTISIKTNSPVELEFSYMGFETRVVTIQPKTALFNMVLNESINQLDDVVVIGYGEVKRRDLTGSVGSVDMADITKAPVVSFEDALAGRVAGVQVGSADGQPGGGSNIIIRGGNSITQSNAPLYVIDGFPMETPDANSINPEEIESIEVLKDASATAIYGARGANGVIMITTKQGKVGAPVVSYNNWVALQSPINDIPVMSAYEFVKYQKELNPTIANSIYFSDGKTEDSYKNVQGIDWYDLLIQKAVMNNHNLSVRGGTATTKYSLSGSFLNQDGIVINSGFRRYQGRFQIDQKLGKKVNIGINTNYSNTLRRGQIANITGDDLTSASSGNSSTYLMYGAWGFRPVSGRSDESEFISDPFDDAVTSDTDLRVNPVLNINNTLNNNYGKSLSTNAYLKYSFLNYFKLDIRGGLYENDSRLDRFNNSKTAAGNPLTLYGSTYGINGSIQNSTTTRLLNENLLTYQRIYNKTHKVNVLGGFTMQRNSSSIDGYTSIKLPNESLGMGGLRQGTVLDKLSAMSYSTMVSFLGRMEYGFKSKYLLTVSFRRDGSSKFSPENRWGNFPSAAIAWNLGEEDFIKNLNVLSSTKLRASYGITGNNRVSDFAYLSVLQQEVGANSANTRSGYYFGNEYLQGTVPTVVGNENLKWERTANLDIGLDIGLLKERIRFTADYYHKKTSDLLLNASLASSTGYLNAFRNIGIVENKGLEFTLNTVNIKNRKFEWTSNFNIAFNQNKIVELNGDEPSLLTRVTTWNSNFNNAIPYIAIPGREVSLFYGYVFDGLYQLSDFNQLPNGSYELKGDVPNNGLVAANIKPGYIKYKDLNGDGKVDANDQTIIGNPVPIHIGGFSNNFRYANFDLNVFLQWSYGNDVLNANRIIFEGAEGRQYLNMFKTYEDRWSLDNQNTLLPVAGGYGPNVFSDRTIEDGSFLRLKTVSLGYSLPVDLLKKWAIRTIRLSVSAQNLVTWTKYSGFDPEVSVRHSALTPGFDWSSYPRARIISAGLNVTF